MHADQLKTALIPLYQRLHQHPMYARICTLADLQRFMEHHVVAVWDFMFLLKALQRQLTSIDLIWKPVGTPKTRRLINEIVLAEESDIINGQAYSHFEYYLLAMQEIGADTGPIRMLLSATPDTFERTLTQSALPIGAKAFLSTTWDIVQQPLPAIAAAFALGREDVIPTMFIQLVKNLNPLHPEKLDLYATYLNRHIELDGDDHGPMALELLNEVCGEDPKKWALAQAAAHHALEARLQLWDSVCT